MIKPYSVTLPPPPRRLPPPLKAPLLEPAGINRVPYMDGYGESLYGDIDSTAYIWTNQGYMGVRQYGSYKHPDGVRIIEDGLPHTIKCDPVERSDVVRSNIAKLSELERSSNFLFYPRQKTVTATIGSVRGALLAAEVGTGKTLMAIGSIAMHQPRVCVVLGPIGTTQGVSPQWMREIKRFYPSAPVRNIRKHQDVSPIIPPGIYLCHPQAFFLNDSGAIAKKFAGHVDMIVFDESQLCVTEKTLVYQQLEMFECPVRLALSATPFMHGASDIVPTIKWVSFGEYEYDEKGTNALFTTPCWAAGKWNKNVPFMVNHAPEFMSKIAPWVAYVSKRDINPHMAELRIKKVLIDPSDDMLKQYHSARRMNSSTLKEGGIRHSVTMNTILGNGSGKADWAVEKSIELSDSGEQVVIISSRLSMSDEIEKCLKKCKISTSRIDSTVNNAKFSDEAKRFKERSSMVMIMGIKCAAAYSFDQCSNMLFVGIDDRSGMVEQAIGRCYRVTSKRPVNVLMAVYKLPEDRALFDSQQVTRMSVEHFFAGKTFRIECADSNTNTN